MKLFELSWRIISGMDEFTQREIRVFKNAKQANRYGDIQEYLYNTGKDVKRKPTEKQLEQAQEDACSTGRTYRFNGANELLSAYGDDGSYEVSLGRRCA